MLTTRFVKGAVNWIDLGTPDVGGASEFYGALFGWRFVSAGPQAGGYGFFQLDGSAVAGGMETTPEQGPPSWTLYFQTPDARATAQAAERAHGRVVVKPMEVMDQGTMAILADEADVVFGLWQPALNPGLGLVNVPGSLCWTELYTADVAAAAAFYHAALGHETSAMPYPGGTYTCVNPEGQGEDAMFAGYVPLADAPDEDSAYWLPYFEVPDTDAAVATAVERGASVRSPAVDLPGVGRFAKLADPYGARFAVITSATEGES
ncbi:VOC family protein [Streptomyces roseirectus]|uniref:VOC family protein n=1 Tax=Streptomyces roseirectus TaxID=2768066 RepID=A0A7H0I8I8_9ACTN|nr:VOC family protein [Streptomyces roseirectus]QNP69104.1 VOC family protein [Streptomyces roseirectus]